MRTFLLAATAVAGLTAIAAPASANEIIRELVANGVIAAADKVGEIYGNGQNFTGNTQKAFNTSKLGNMTKFWDPNEGKYVYGSVTAANIGNSISVEDVTPAPKTYTDTVKTTVSGGFIGGGVAFTDGLEVEGTAKTKGLDTDTYAHLPIIGTVELDGKVTENAPVHGEVQGNAPVVVAGVFGGTKTVTTTVREFVKGDVYLNGQSATGNSQYAELATLACVTCTGVTAPTLENVSQTAANIANSISIEDKSSRYRGESGDVYVNIQHAAGNTQTALANANFAGMLGGAITAANIGNSISIKDACGVCE